MTVSVLSKRPVCHAISFMLFHVARSHNRNNKKMPEGQINIIIHNNNKTATMMIINLNSVGSTLSHLFLLNFVLYTGHRKCIRSHLFFIVLSFQCINFLCSEALIQCSTLTLTHTRTLSLFSLY